MLWVCHLCILVPKLAVQMHNTERAELISKRLCSALSDCTLKLMYPMSVPTPNTGTLRWGQSQLPRVSLVSTPACHEELVALLSEEF